MSEQRQQPDVQDLQHRFQEAADTTRDQADRIWDERQGLVRQLLELYRQIEMLDREHHATLEAASFFQQRADELAALAPSEVALEPASAE